MRFADFVLRFAADITPEVAPPFYILAISPSNRVRHVKNATRCPVPRNDVLQALEVLQLK
jgi:hypothetical protein